MNLLLGVYMKDNVCEIWRHIPTIPTLCETEAIGLKTQAKVRQLNYLGKFHFKI